MYRCIGRLPWHPEEEEGAAGSQAVMLIKSDVSHTVPLVAPVALVIPVTLSDLWHKRQDRIMWLTQKVKRSAAGASRETDCWAKCRHIVLTLVSSAFVPALVLDPSHITCFYEKIEIEYQGNVASTIIHNTKQM